MLLVVPAEKLSAPNLAFRTVATVAAGKSGPPNAAILAVQMLALSDGALAEKLKIHKEKLVKSVQAANEKLS